MKKERADRKLTIEKLKEIMVELTETAFMVKVGSDDSGAHMCAYVERDLDGNDVCKRPPMIWTDGEWFVFSFLTDTSGTFWKQQENEKGGFNSVIPKRREFEVEQELPSRLRDCYENPA